MQTAKSIVGQDARDGAKAVGKVESVIPQRSGSSLSIGSNRCPRMAALSYDRPQRRVGPKARQISV
jgi:hypothetical protein